jgi:hypothetical protein
LTWFCYDARPELAMNLKSPWKPIGQILLWAIPLSSPFSLAGCGQTACITWSENEGACPAQDEALMFFQNPACPSSVVSVDSDGAFANNLCCYGVTKVDSSFGSGDFSCFPGGGVGGGFGATSVGAVTSGGPPPPISLPCFRCAQALEDQTASAGNICTASQDLFDLVQSCMCKGACTSACANNFCSFNDASSACLSCVSDTSTDCGIVFDKCANDV